MSEFCDHCDVSMSLHPYPESDDPEVWECEAAEAKADLLARYP